MNPEQDPCVFFRVLYYDYDLGAYMKIAVVCYSMSGNCALVAEEIRAKLDADLLRLRTKGEKPRQGFFKFLWGICVMLGIKKAPLKPYTFDPAAYDLIVIGAPVWGGGPARPMLDFLSKTSITGKKIALFVCHAGGEGTAMEQLKTLLSANDITAETSFLEVEKNAENVKQQAAEWAKALQAK
jgi:flavodoxin